MANRASISCHDILGQPLLIPKSGTTRARLNTWLEPVENEIQISMELDSTEMIKQFVMAGLGLSFLAASHCREELANGRLAVVSLAPEPMIRRLGLIYRKDKSLSKAALGFIQVIIDHAASDEPQMSYARAPQAART
jgi:DNA-binding transcriptional LysR family regulator